MNSHARSVAEGMVKVGLRAPGGEFETMWATPVGENRYRLENSPFFAYGVSWQDVVEAVPEPDNESELPVMVAVVTKGGHRTVRLILVPGVDADPDQAKVLDALIALGCTYEGYNPRYFSLDLAPEMDMGPVVEYLIGEKLEWEYADPTYEEVHAHEASRSRGRS